MQNSIPDPPTLIIPLGTQVVLRSEILPHPAGAVAEIIGCPSQSDHPYRIRFPDAAEITLTRNYFSILKQIKQGPLSPVPMAHASRDLDEFIIYRCIVGSQAYGLSRDTSDIDRRGIYLPPADMHWSLFGIPQQLENIATEECYWELEKFLKLALKANPNILECLYTPLVEYKSEIAEALLEQRHIFLSKLVFQTYNGYVMSQFKKLEQDLRSTGSLKWKHAMHLIRLQLQGIAVLQQAHVPVFVSEHRRDLLSIQDGERSWAEVNEWRLDLHRQFEAAFQSTSLPDLPDYAAANQLLIKARRSMLEVRF